jgi:hypothetical protein
VARGHFITNLSQNQFWKQDIGGQVYIRILVNFVKDVIGFRKLETKNKKFGQVSNNASKGTFYKMGFRFYRSN